MDDLIARLRHLSSRRITAEFRNALKEAADALERATERESILIHRVGSLVKELDRVRNESLEDAALKCDELAAKYLRKQSAAKHLDAINMFEDRAAAATICGRAIRAMKEKK